MTPDHFVCECGRIDVKKRAIVGLSSMLSTKLVHAPSHDTNFLNYLKVCGCQRLCVQHGVRTEPSTPYRSRLRERTKDPCPYERALPTLSQRTSCIGEQCERHRANPSPTYAQRVITSPAQRSTAEGAPWPIPRNCPPSPPPWPLISQRHGLVRRPRPPQNILRRPKNVPSAHAHPHPSERGPMHACVHLQVHACACGSSPRRTHAIVKSRWAHSRSKPLILSSP